MCNVRPSHTLIQGPKILRLVTAIRLQRKRREVGQDQERRSDQGGDEGVRQAQGRARQGGQGTAPREVFPPRIFDCQ
jgi:hypothetical protein